MSEQEHPSGPLTAEADGAARRRTNGTRASARLSKGIVALGSAAVVAVYSAGFYKTKAAADRLSGPAGRGGGPIPGGPGRAMGPGAPVPDSAPPAVALSEPASLVARPESSAPAVTVAVPTVPRVEGPTALAERAASSSEASNVVASPTGQPGLATQPVAAPAAPGAAAVASEAGATPAATASAPNSANATTLASSEPPAAAKGKFKDGVYTGWGTCRHGDIQAKLEIKDGRIVTSEISQCLTRYSCSWISPLPPQVLHRQSENVDYVSGATDSAVAFYWAVFDALSKAK